MTKTTKKPVLKWDYGLKKRTMCFVLTQFKINWKNTAKKLAYGAMRVEILKYDLLSREGTQIEYSVTDVIMAHLNLDD